MFSYMTLIRLTMVIEITSMPFTTARLNRSLQMKNSECVVWIQGYLEIIPYQKIDRPKLRIIRNHLNLVQAVGGQLTPSNRSIKRMLDHVLAEEQEADLDMGAALYEAILPIFRRNFPESYVEHL